MFSIRVEYLTGRAVATRYNDRTAAEWPPHPGRVFAAMVAAWADTERPDPDERVALDWLASLPPPSLAFSSASLRGIQPRRGEGRVVPVTHFVPVNDASLVGDPSREREGLTAAEVALKSATPAERRSAERAMAKAQASFEQAVRTSVMAPVKWTDAALEQASSVLPEHRKRQARTFPSVTAEDPVVWFTWSAEQAEAHAAALARILDRVASVGHSSSLVTCALVPSSPPPLLVPDPDGAEVLRVAASDTVARLQEAHTRHRGLEPRVTPLRFVRYGPPGARARIDATASVNSGEWIVLRRVGGARLSVTAGVSVASAVRAALMRYADQPVHEALSGHRPDGSPGRSPHVAVVPLPDVAHPHANGALLGVALALPRTLDEAGRRAVLRAVARWEAEARASSGLEDDETPALRVLLGRAGVVEVERVAWGEPQLSGLRSDTWAGPAQTWVSVTPVALDRNPGNLNHVDPRHKAEAWNSAEAIVGDACGHVGLPYPVAVVATSAPQVEGSAPVRAWPAYPPTASKTRRVKVHARVTFAEPVVGPVLLGAGRYYGLGLFRPADEEADHGK